MGYERQVACALLPTAHGAEQIDGDFSRLLNFVDRICTTNFPMRQGYLTFSEPLDETGNGVRMRVIHDDFQAQVDLHCDLSEGGDGSTAPMIRMKTTACSQRLEKVEHASEREEALWRSAGAGTGAALVVAGALAVVGLGDVLPAMFFLVLSAAFPVAGWCLGGWVGEKIASGKQDRALGEACTDKKLQRDLRRWKALSRQLLSRRRWMATDRRHLPFRR